MKTNFSQKNNVHRKAKLRKHMIGVVAVLCFVFFSSTSFGRNMITVLTEPVWRFREHVAQFFSDQYALLSSKQALIIENQKLKQELVSREHDRVLRETLERDYTELLETLGRKLSKDTWVSAVILSKPSFSPYDTLVIDIGADHGVQKGDKVIAEGDVFLGNVSEVRTNVSVVTLYSSAGEKTPVLIGKNRIEKEALGLGGGNFQVEMPRESSIAVGDPIIIPSVSPNIFSIVERIHYEEVDAFQTILFKNSVNIHELKWVSVLIHR